MAVHARTLTSVCKSGIGPIMYKIIKLNLSKLKFPVTSL